MASKRGHSNVKSSETRPWDEVDPKSEAGIARIPLQGGASITTFRDLPSLSLRRHEWEEIGRRMGWK